MQRTWISGAKSRIATVTLSFALFASPSAVLSQSAPATALNQAWVAKMTDLLKLSPAQQSVLNSFAETSSRSAGMSAPTAAQVRAMTFVQQFDYWAAQTVTIQSRAQADAQALHRFYASLSLPQREQFDAATRSHDPDPNIAADVIPTPGREEPDYKLPAHTNPDWLVKPTAANVARVYPFAAAEARITGQAVLRCVVDIDGYLGDCVVGSEQPAGQGFGNAALEITAYMRMQPATNYGVPTRAWINVPIAFTLPDPD